MVTTRWVTQMPDHAPPWVAGNLWLPPSLMAEVEAHAVEAYPNECCGFLCGPAARSLELASAIRGVNEADRYHRLDPVRFPRTARTYFKINELWAARTFEAQAARREPVKVIYHSHTDAGAYFSEEDAATFASAGQLMWPCAFLVVSVHQGEVRDRKLWVHVPGTNDFRESPLAVGPRGDPSRGKPR